MKPQELADLWMKICRSLPPIRPRSLIMDKEKSPTRYRSTLRQLKLHPEKAFWTLVFKSVEESDYLSGRNGVWSACGFDWVIFPKNLVKVYEGNYGNKRGQVGMSKKEEDEHFRLKELNRASRGASEPVPMSDLFKSKE